MRLPVEIAEALAEDAGMLAALHDRELTPGAIAALLEAGFPANLGLLPANDAARAAWRKMAAALPRNADGAALDLLAADYAAIYLTGAFGASPCESVWLDEDHLVCQAPMFALREIYAAAGLAAENWRRRPDDHLVLQLLYIAHALRRALEPDDWRRLAALLDGHLLRWLPGFAERVGRRAKAPFYAALAGLTLLWCEQLRDLLADFLGEARPPAVEAGAGAGPGERDGGGARPTAWRPGAGPGW